MMADKPIAIALATFNGEPYIEEQVRSIQNNTDGVWHLIIRDDGSTDGTLELIEKLQAQDDRIILLTDDHGNLGHAQNFNIILEYVLQNGYELFALCDQDDYWQPTKIAMLRDTLKQPDIPTLVYSDLEIVNTDLSSRTLSFFTSLGYQPGSDEELEHLLMENHIPGCVQSGNRALLSKSLPIPQGIANHDWWLALSAIIFGQLSYLNEPLVKYRQHDNNQIGSGLSLKRLNPFGIVKRLRSQLQTTAMAIHTLFNRWHSTTDEIQQDKQPVLRLFFDLYSQKHFRLIRVISLYQAGFRVHHSHKWLVHLLCKGISY